jgi:citrate lyase subunit beta-like protein
VFPSYIYLLLANDVLHDCISERAKRIRLLVAIESPLAIMNLKKIAKCDPRIDALIFASEDYCAETGMRRTASRKELYYARSAVATVAHAYGLQPIDLVCMDYENHAILREECREGVEMGYQGKQAIHPGQIDIVHREFSPRAEDIDYARLIVQGYQQHVQTGIGVFDLNGKVIDLPVVKWAERILSYANLMQRDKTD